MATTYHDAWWRRLANTLLITALKVGLGPPRIRLLTVKGRSSGREYSTPVALVARDGGTYLVSPYGERQWTKNARTAGEATFSRGKMRRTRRLEELPAAAAAPILKQYLNENPIVRSFFEAKPDSSDAAFEAEASRHPVFRIL